MFVKTVSYKTYDGVPVTEDFYFNFTQAEIMEIIGKEESVARIKKAIELLEK